MITDNQNPQDILDEEHLRLLSLFHYVRAGSTAFVACIPLIHVIMGSIMIIASQHVPAKQNEPSLALMGGIFVVVGLTIVILGWLLAVLQFLVGRFIKLKQHRTFCMVMAGVNCLAIPYGTLAGVMTFIVLGRDSVRARFMPNTVPVVPSGLAPQG